MDLSAWPTAKQFTAWLGLAPSKYSSGKVTKNKKRKSSTKAGQIFKEASVAILNSKNHALGSFGRKIRSGRGPNVAIKAIARKIAVMYYYTLTQGINFVEQGIQAYEDKYRHTQRRQLEKKARQFNLQLVPLE